MKKIFIFAILFFSFNIHSAFSENEDILINQMRTGSGIEKLEAITKLGEIDNIHTSNALIIELLLDKNSFAIKKYISDTLAKTKNPETIYALIRFLDNENYTIKMYITEILEKIGQPAIKPLLDTITPDNSSRLKAYAVYILKTIQNSNLFRFQSTYVDSR